MGKKNKQKKVDNSMPINYATKTLKEGKAWVVNTIFDEFFIGVTRDLAKRFKMFCMAIDSSELSGMEFSLIAEGKMEENVLVIDENTLWLPKQEVSGTSVDFLVKEFTDEELERYNKCNVIIHRHPWANASAFSSSDDTTLSRNYDASLLLEKSGEITDATVRVKLASKGYFIVEKVKIGYKKEDVTEVTSEFDLALISKKTYIPAATSFYDDDFDYAEYSQNRFGFARQKDNKKIWEREKKKEEKETIKEETTEKIEVVKDFKELNDVFNKDINIDESTISMV